MTDDPFRVLPAWPDTIVYEEGDADASRSIRFDTRSMAEPPQVCVPVKARWAATMPAWATARRDEIVARLRGARCVVVEVDSDLDRYLVPDGSLMIDVSRENEERSGTWEMLRVVTLPGGFALTQIFNRGAPVELRFDQPGAVSIRLDDHLGVRRDVRVDIASRSFRLDTSGAAEPLDRLLDRLGWNDPPVPFMPTVAIGPPSRLLAWLGLLACAVFVAGGLWMAVTATTPKDRWAGLAGAVFFGACGWGFLPRVR